MESLCNVICVEYAAVPTRCGRPFCFASSHRFFPKGKEKAHEPLHQNGVRFLWAVNNNNLRGSAPSGNPGGVF